jgi:hypothetical protein
MSESKYDNYLQYLENVRKFCKLFDDSNYERKITIDGVLKYKDKSSIFLNEIIPPQFLNRRNQFELLLKYKLIKISKETRDSIIFVLTGIIPLNHNLFQKLGFIQGSNTSSISKSNFAEIITRTNYIDFLTNLRSILIEQSQNIQMNSFINGVIQYNELVDDIADINQRVNQLKMIEISPINDQIDQDEAKLKDLLIDLSKLIEDRESNYTFTGETLEEYKHWETDGLLKSEWLALNTRYYQILKSVQDINMRLFGTDGSYQKSRNLEKFNRYIMIRPAEFIGDKLPEPKINTVIEPVKKKLVGMKTKPTATAPPPEATKPTDKIDLGLKPSNKTPLKPKLTSPTTATTATTSPITATTSPTTATTLTPKTAIKTKTLIKTKPLAPSTLPSTIPSTVPSTLPSTTLSTQKCNINNTSGKTQGNVCNTTGLWVGITGQIGVNLIAKTPFNELMFSKGTDLTQHSSIMHKLIKSVIDDQLQRLFKLIVSENINDNSASIKLFLDKSKPDDYKKFLDQNYTETDIVVILTRIYKVIKNLSKE